MVLVVYIPQDESIGQLLFVIVLLGPRDSAIRLLAIVIFDLGQIEKTGTIFFN